MRSRSDRSSNPEPTSDAMNVDSTSPTAETDYLHTFAVKMDLITPQSPHLTEEDRVDLALFDQLIQTQAQVQRAMGVETEIVETEKWNVDTVQQLLHMSKDMLDIPFPKRAELFDLHPTCGDRTSSPGPPPGKGKKREAKKPFKRSIYHSLPSFSKDIGEDSWGESQFPLTINADPEFRLRRSSLTSATTPRQSR